MKSSKVTLEAIADPENLREAFLRAARGKAHRPEVIAFRSDLDGQVLALREGILLGTVRVGECNAFTIFEPKERRIHAPSFRERVLHHALVGPSEADFDRWLIHDSYACRRGKGREAALRRAEGYALRHRWFLKLDVARYFDSIPHGELLAQLEPGIRDARVWRLWARIVHAYQSVPERGLPIGALTSQHLANFYLGTVDRLVKETLGVPGYVRYMDDMALWGDVREEMMSAKRAVEAHLSSKLGLQLNSRWHLQPAQRGMDFLGYRVFPFGSCLNRASMRRFRRRWQAHNRALDEGRISEGEAQRRVLALTAFVRVARQETILQRLFGFRAPAIGHEPRPSRRELEERRAELSLGQPQQELARQPQRQPRLPARPELTPEGPSRAERTEPAGVQLPVEATGAGGDK